MGCGMADTSSAIVTKPDATVAAVGDGKKRERKTKKMEREERVTNAWVRWRGETKG